MTRRVTFDELVSEGSVQIGDGYRAKNSELGGDGPLFLRAAMLTRSGFVWAGERFANRVVPSLSNKMGHPGDTVVTTKGNSVGRTGFVPDDAPPFVYSPHLSYWRSLNHSVVMPGFIRYWAQGPEFKSQLRAMAHGTDMAPYLSLADQYRLRISLPSIAHQEFVVATLGPLDDKIDTNGRTSALLDELARAVFRHWRSQAAHSVETTFGSFAEVFGGATPTTSNPDYWSGNLAWATPTDVTRSAVPYLFETNRKITSAGLNSCTATMHPPGTILMTSRATIGAFAVNQVPMATNQGFIAVRPARAAHRWFIFEEMRSRVAEFLGNANGSTFLELSRGRFKTLGLSLPFESELESLDRVLGPLHAKAAQLARESLGLCQLREALLPELLAGRLSAGGRPRLYCDESFDCEVHL